MKYQLDIRIFSDGYLTVEADSPSHAKAKVKKLEPEVHFPTFTLETSDVDISEFDGIGSEIEINDVQEIEEA